MFLIEVILLKHSLSIIFVQLLGALISISAAAYITAKEGAIFFGEINAWLGLFTILSTMSFLGIPEYMQKRFALGATPIIVYRYIPLLLIVNILLSVFFIQMDASTNLNVKYFDAFYIAVYSITLFIIEVIARYFFQASKAILGQSMITGMSSSFWLFSLLFLTIIESNNISKMIVYSVAPMMLIAFYLLLLFNKNSTQNIILSDEKSGIASYLNPYLVRVNVVLLDWLPILLLSKLGMFEIAGYYALAIRILMPISLASSAVANYLQKEGLSNKLSMSKANAVSVAYLGLLCIFGVIVLLAVKENPFNFLFDAAYFINENIVALSLLFAYRVIYLVFNFASTVLLAWVIDASYWLIVISTVATGLIGTSLFITFNGDTLSYLTLISIPVINIVIIQFFSRKVERV